MDTRLREIVFSLVTETVFVGSSPILCLFILPLLVTQLHDRTSLALYSGPNLFMKWTKNLCVNVPAATRCRSWQQGTQTHSFCVHLTRKPDTEYKPLTLTVIPRVHLEQSLAAARAALGGRPLPIGGRCR